MRRFSLTELMIIVAIVGILVFPFIRGLMVDDGIASRAASARGFTEIVVKDRTNILPIFKGCSAQDAAAFNITAVNPAGDKVDLVVCAGWPFKGATVRSH